MVENNYGLSHLFKWENLHNWWLTKYFFAPLYVDCFLAWKKVLFLILDNVFLLRTIERKIFSMHEL